MSDLAISAAVSRDELGLADLDIDSYPYTLTTNITPGPVTYRRETVTSPYVDGEFTISRAKERPELQLAIDVDGANTAEIEGSVAILIAAMTQDSFELSISVNGVVNRWACECADYAVSFDQVRFFNNKITCAFTIPRDPLPILGVF